ncbi:hypothetical protein RB595_004672 [Gaeumannomyces hyphopodioides]
MSNALGPTQQPAARVTSWLQTCDKDHKECQQPFDPDYAARFSVGRIPSLCFRLLDIELGCVRNASLDERYVAFSYVSSDSSTSPSFRLTKSSLENATTEGWLKTIRPSLAGTISDAIDFVRAVGERYLWVDALCFARDSGRDKFYCERVMASVYRGSYFTLVAAPGVGTDSGPTVDEHDLTDPTKVHDLNWHLSRSAYRWTLGELVLSRRLVVSIAGRVFFSCQSSQKNDQTCSEQAGPFKLLSKRGAVLSVPPPFSGLLPSVTAYLDLTEEYS